MGLVANCDLSNNCFEDGFAIKPVFIFESDETGIVNAEDWFEGFRQFDNKQTNEKNFEIHGCVVKLNIPPQDSKVLRQYLASRHQLKIVLWRQFDQKYSETKIDFKYFACGGGGCISCQMLGTPSWQAGSKRSYQNSTSSDGGYSGDTPPSSVGGIPLSRSDFLENSGPYAEGFPVHASVNDCSNWVSSAYKT